jgi:hypothetical protein
MESAVTSAVAGTPTFFINGARHPGGYDLDADRGRARCVRSRGLADARR